MKKIRNNNVLIFFSFLSFILLIIFLFLSIKIKLWTFKAFPYTKLNSKNIVILIDKKSIKEFTLNNFFYEDNKKYVYDIINKEKYNNNYMLSLKLKKRIYKKSGTLYLVNKKKNIFSLIIESWRVKWKK